MEKDNVYEYDKASGHLFCKYCGNNYLLKKHKEDCPTLKCCPYCGKATEREDEFCSANCKKFYLIG